MEQNPVLPDQAMSRGAFWALCTFLLLLLACAVLALLADDTALGTFVSLDEFYVAVVLLESIFGVFLLPFVMHASPGLAPSGKKATSRFGRNPGISGSRAILADYVIVFTAGAPFVVLAAFAAGTSWYAVVPTQILVFSTWSVALGTKELLEVRRASAQPLSGKLVRGQFYLPLAAILFFGLVIAGRVLTGFSDAAGELSAFSVPGVLTSWCAGRYFGSNGWLGIVTCLGAFALWSRKVMAAYEPQAHA